MVSAIERVESVILDILATGQEMWFPDIFALLPHHLDNIFNFRDAIGNLVVNKQIIYRNDESRSYYRIARSNEVSIYEED